MPKLRDHTAIAARGEMFRVDPRQLKTDPTFNVRDLNAQTAREALDTLKEQIKADGVQTPLEVRLQGDDVYITSGHRRHKVVMELIAEGTDIQTVPAIAEPRTIDEADRTARLITLNAGEPLTQLEKAEVVRRLMNFGWPRAKIAPVFGFKTEQSVANLELLLTAPHEVKQAIRDGELAPSAAVNIMRQSNGDQSAAKETLARARSAAAKRGTTRLTNRTTDNATAAPTAKPPRNQAAVDKALALLNEVRADSYEPSIAASAYIAQDANTIALILDWLTKFEDRLRQREDARQQDAA